MDHRRYGGYDHVRSYHEPNGGADMNQLTVLQSKLLTVVLAGMALMLTLIVVMMGWGIIKDIFKFFGVWL